MKRLRIEKESLYESLQRALLLERQGRYEEAQNALFDLWPGVGIYPLLRRMGESEQAETLLTVSIIMGRLGSVRQTAAAARCARGMSYRSFKLYEAAGNSVKAAHALIELGHCHWRAGKFDKARSALRDALSRLDAGECELRALALLRLSVVEKATGRLFDALNLLEQCAPLLKETDSHFLKGIFFNTRALVLKRLGIIDKALTSYAEASRHFEEAGHARYRARVENNFGMLSLQLGRYGEAHEHLDRARTLFAGLRDEGSVAQVDETRARVLIGERRFNYALRIIRGAVRTFERGGESGLLAEALTTQGVALARAGYRERARGALDRALSVAEEAGDCEGAGRAALTIIEELGEQTSAQDMARLYERSTVLLRETQDAPTVERVRACSLAVINRLSAAPSSQEAGRGTVYHFPNGLPHIETFTVHVPDCSLKEAGIPEDAPIKFRLTMQWNEGDLVFVVTPDGNLIVYVYKDVGGYVRMEGAHPDCPVRRYKESEVLVFGVAATRSTRR